MKGLNRRHISPLSSAQAQIWVSVPLLPQPRSVPKVRISSKSDSLRAFFTEGQRRRGGVVGKSAQVRNMNSTKHSGWFATFVSSIGNSRLVPFPGIAKGAAVHLQECFVNFYVIFSFHSHSLMIILNSATKCWLAVDNYAGSLFSSA